MSEVQLSRRGFFRGLGAVLAAPAIVKVASLMPVKAPELIVLNPRNYATLMAELNIWLQGAAA